MKLPKGFGGQGIGGYMQQAKSAMARAKNLEAELQAEQIPVDKGPVKALFNGQGEMLSVSIDKSVVDPDDVEALEDLILGCMKDGFTKSVELRNARLAEIMPNIPGMGSLGL
ncbi:MAG: YbaB/EbfC family nucleoid-associated protein [Armatimonadetes bacterium]|nr:YbaB/EbfC family nucleoid-associated protein [Armatimonadota bacterium]